MTVTEEAAGVDATKEAAPALIGGSLVSTIINAVVPPVNMMIRALNATPSVMYDASIDATRKLAAKVGEYADAMSGRSSGNDTDTQGLMIEKKHRTFLDDLRKRDMPSYRRLLDLAVKLADMQPDQQAATLVAYFAPPAQET